MIFLKLLFVYILSFFSYVYSSEWDYKFKGPDTWFKEYPACKGILQSPINIKKSKAVYSSKLKPIEFFRYNQIYFWKVLNNGHTIVGTQVSNRSVPYIIGSDFEERFYLSQFHFHWGFNIFQGSEHYIDQKKFPLEIHLVHKSISGKSAVISFLFEISDRENFNLVNLIKAVQYDIHVKDYITIPLNLRSILPNFDQANKLGYYRYIGSLTTPPCTEGVIWTIYESKISISELQMKAFHSNKIEFNFRELNELGSRSLYFSQL